MVNRLVVLFWKETYYKLERTFVQIELVIHLYCKNPISFYDQKQLSQERLTFENCDGKMVILRPEGIVGVLNWLYQRLRAFVKIPVNVFTPSTMRERADASQYKMIWIKFNETFEQNILRSVTAILFLNNGKKQNVFIRNSSNSHNLKTLSLQCFSL